MKNAKLAQLEQIRHSNNVLMNQLNDSIDAKMIKFKTETVKAAEYVRDNLTIRYRARIPFPRFDVRIKSDRIIFMNLAWKEPDKEIIFSEANCHEFYSFTDMAKEITFMEYCKEMNFPKVLYDYVDETLDKEISTAQMETQSITELFERLNEI